MTAIHQRDHVDAVLEGGNQNIKEVVVQDHSDFLEIQGHQSFVVSIVFVSAFVDKLGSVACSVGFQKKEYNKHDGNRARVSNSTRGRK